MSLSRRLPRTFEGLRKDMCVSSRLFKQVLHELRHGYGRGQGGEARVDQRPHLGVLQEGAG